MFLRDPYTRTIKGDIPPSSQGLPEFSPVGGEEEFGEAVPAIGNEPGRGTQPVGSAVLARAQDIALFLAFLA